MSLRRVTISTVLAAALAGTVLAGGASTASAARIVDPSTATLRQLEFESVRLSTRPHWPTRASTARWSPNSSTVLLPRT